MKDGNEYVVEPELNQDTHGRREFSIRPALALYVNQNPANPRVIVGRTFRVVGFDHGRLLLEAVETEGGAR